MNGYLILKFYSFILCLALSCFLHHLPFNLFGHQNSGAPQSQPEVLERKENKDVSTTELPSFSSVSSTLSSITSPSGNFACQTVIQAITRAWTKSAISSHCCVVNRDLKTTIQKKKKRILQLLQKKKKEREEIYQDANFFLKKTNWVAFFLSKTLPSRIQQHLIPFWDVVVFHKTQKGQIQAIVSISKNLFRLSVYFTLLLHQM